MAIRRITTIECETGNLGIGFIDENDNYLELDGETGPDTIRAILDEPDGPARMFQIILDLIQETREAVVSDLASLYERTD